jgi:hypothetical protein
MELDWFVFSVGMSETWREGRKLLDRSLRPGATVSYRQMMQEKTHWFLAQLFANPKEFHHHIKLSLSHLPYIEQLLTTRQPPGETYNLTHLWSRPKGRG